MAFCQRDHACPPLLTAMKFWTKVLHERLLLKLKAYGIAGNLLNGYDHSLGTRNWQVLINLTGLRCVWNPTGLVLGPILYIMHIKDLPSVLSNSLLNLFSCNDDIRRLKKDIENLQRWSEVYGRCLKCKSLHLGYVLQPYSMGGKCIEQTKEEKDLGVLTDNQV